MKQTNTDLSLAIIAIAAFSFSGWLIFTGINRLFPQLSTLQPIMQIVVGFISIFVLVKIGMRKVQ